MTCGAPPEDGSALVAQMGPSRNTLGADTARTQVIRLDCYAGAYCGPRDSLAQTGDFPGKLVAAFLGVVGRVLPWATSPVSQKVTTADPGSANANENLTRTR